MERSNTNSISERNPFFINRFPISSTFTLRISRFYVTSYCADTFFFIGFYIFTSTVAFKKLANISFREKRNG